MIKKLFMFVLLLILAGCNSVYEYVFLPPQRVEYTLVPDKDAVVQLGDTSYFISGDGISMGYDAKSWKIEIKYMSDYQLNKFEFPEESNDGEFSGNPYTYGNWIDPELDYTPRRFTVFKVTIYNYTGSKLNYDPELSVLQTDRGDNFNAYAREQKNSKFYSMEEYYQKRKGTSGVDDEIFETRMGIARRTMLYYGKPVYKGDSRDGLIVFNPIVDDIEKLKITVKDFVTGYDENNEPSEFQDFVFYFKQVPVKEQTLNELNAQYILDSDSSSVLKGKITVAQIEYKRQITSVGREVDVWNPIPIAIPSLLEYLEQKTTLNSTFITGTFTDEDVKESNLAIILGGLNKPDLKGSIFISACANYIQNGGIVYIDNSFLKSDYSYISIMEEFVNDVKSQLSGKVEYKEITPDHPVFTLWQKLDPLPKGYDDYVNPSELGDHLDGLFINGKLGLILSNKGYPRLWAEKSGSNFEIEKPKNFGINLIIYALKNY